VHSCGQVPNTHIQMLHHMLSFLQTDITSMHLSELLNSASTIVTKDSRIDELIKEKEENSKEIQQLKKDYELQASTLKKCLSVNKKLLVEKVLLNFF
jgi:hypothetical protein